MRLVYFDEVKFNPPRQPLHWIGALSVPVEAIASVEDDINRVAKGFFGTADLTRVTEFHAVDMIHGSAHFKGRDCGERIEALERLLLIANRAEIRRISVNIRPANMIAKLGIVEKAFLFLIEKVEHDLSKAKSSGIIIGDLDTEYADLSVTSLSQYRQSGTPYAFGRKIDRIVDGAHFIPSHHSRLVQLADAYAYVLQLLAADESADTYPKKRLRAFVREKTNLSWAHSFKDGPSNDSWAFSHYVA